MLTAELIRRKRDGLELSAEEVSELVAGIADGSVSDAQVGALAMAIFLRGMSASERVALTGAMTRSGEVLEWGDAGLAGPVLDKHSTGGVGDKVSLLLAPIVAACGAAVPMISGRGLGHTGGTLDKLEAIPGYDVAPDSDRLRAAVARVGCAIVGQTASLAPADRRLYAIRDATGTVESIPLITGSILSKKVASGATRLVLDVKAGEGAFMPDAESAGELASLMERLGEANGIETHAVISSMDEPLGRAVGNALEVEEAVATLSGTGPTDLHELVLSEASVLVGDADRVAEALRSGAALETYRRWIAAQGGDPDAELPHAPVVADVTAPDDAAVVRCHARRVGDLAMELGGGRLVKGAPIDHAVGVVVHKKGGDQVARGEPLATVHSREPVDAERVLACFQLEPVDA